MLETATCPPPTPTETAEEDYWQEIRREFDLSPDWIHLGTSQFVASHPRPVREAIERHRRALDENPVLTLKANEDSQMQAVREAAARHLGAQLREEIALTDSTTMGLGLAYAGFPFQPGDEIVISRHEHYAHRESVRGAGLRHGLRVHEVALHDGCAAAAEPGALVDAVMQAVSERTRVVGVTWVHSETGLKFPVRRLADALAEINRRRDPQRRIHLLVDGVHGFGIEPDTVGDLGCDFFATGTHKWLYGPRGTGLLWARLDTWRQMRPVIPAFAETFDAYADDQPLPPMDGRQFTPGGFHSFEHRWAATQAFEFHARIGRDRIAARVHRLNRLCKEGLAAMAHVTLHTPMSDELSAGIVAFEIRGMASQEAARRLRERRVIATVAPYPSAFLRFTPGIINSPQDIEQALEAVRALG